MSIEELREKIENADFHLNSCLKKADDAERDGDLDRADMYDDFADAAEEELNELWRDLREAQDGEGAQSRRDTLHDQSWARQS